MRNAPLSKKRKKALEKDINAVRRLYDAAVEQHGREEVHRDLSRLWDLRCIWGMQGVLPFKSTESKNIGELYYVARDLLGIAPLPSPPSEEDYSQTTFSWNPNQEFWTLGVVLSNTHKYTNRLKFHSIMPTMVRTTQTIGGSMSPIHGSNIEVIRLVYDSFKRATYAATIAKKLLIGMGYNPDDIGIALEQGDFDPFDLMHNPRKSFTSYADEMGSKQGLFVIRTKEDRLNAYRKWGPPIVWVRPGSPPTYLFNSWKHPEHVASLFVDDEQDGRPMAVMDPSLLQRLRNPFGGDPPPHVLEAKWKRLIAGEKVVTNFNEIYLITQMHEDDPRVNRIATIANPDQVGYLDEYIAWIKGAGQPFEIVNWPLATAWVQPCMRYGERPYDVYRYSDCVIIALALPFDKKSQPWKRTGQLLRAYRGDVISKIMKVLKEHFAGFDKVYKDDIRVTFGPSSYNKSYRSFHLARRLPGFKSWSDSSGAGELHLEDAARYVHKRWKLQWALEAALHNMKRARKLFGKAKALKKQPPRDLYIKALTRLVEAKKHYDLAAELHFPPYLLEKTDELGKASDAAGEAVNDLSRILP